MSRLRNESEPRRRAHDFSVTERVVQHRHRKLMLIKAEIRVNRNIRVQVGIPAVPGRQHSQKAVTGAARIAGSRIDSRTSEISGNSSKKLPSNSEKERNQYSHCTCWRGSVVDSDRQTGHNTAERILFLLLHRLDLRPCWKLKEV